MKSLRLKQYALLFLSGVFAAYVISNAIFLLSWVCYIPLFLLLKDKSAKEYFFSGIAFALGVSSVLFFWIIGGAKEFSGNHLFYGFLVAALSIILFCLYWTGVITIVGLGLKKIFSGIVKALFVASCFVLAESLLSFFFSQIPYYLFNSGYGLLANVYTIQWASFFGLPILNFLVVFVNYMAAEFIIAKRWKQLTLPLGIVTLTVTAGFFIKINTERNIVPLRAVKIAIAAENIPPQLKWDEHGGNILAQRLLSLNKQAALLNPDIVLWSESTIPWTYRPDDDLLKALLKEPYSPKAVHIIGFMSDHSKSKVYNSIYGITTNGEMLGRYDKTFLLNFVETPMFGLNMPFLDLDGYLIEKGNNRMPITTPAGKAGIAICNEIAKPEASLKMVKNGAEFLLNSSNDGWFKDSFIVGIHFLYARLSAVINRKDIVLNSNNGISGYVKATGEVVLKRKSKDFFTETVVIAPNRYDNSKHYFPHGIPFLCLLLVISVFLGHFFKLNRNR